jgi:excinuclease UvrABC ATPase subunit
VDRTSPKSERVNILRKVNSIETAADVYASLQLLFSRIGQPFVGYSNVFSFNNPQGMCPTCQGLGYTNQINIEQLAASVRANLPAHLSISDISAKL